MAIFGIALVINISMKPRRVFRNKGITVLILGLYSWIAYVLFASVSGIFMKVDMDTYKEILSITVCLTTAFLIARCVIAYDWRKELIIMLCLEYGIALAAAYILNHGQLDTAELVARSGNILQEGGRYRISLGLGHVNSAGSTAFFFLVMASLYRAFMKDRDGDSKKLDRFHTFFLVPVSFIALIILAASSSRTSISSLIVYYMTYFYINFQAKLGGYIKFMVIAAVIAAFVYIVSIVNWDFVLRESGRLDGLIAIGTMSHDSSFFTGRGFMKGHELLGGLGIIYLDSGHMVTFVRTGLIGFSIHIGAMLYFVREYFRGLRRMTNLQKAAGAMLVSCLYIDFFEHCIAPIAHGPFLAAFWAIFIAEINDKAAMTKQKGTGLSRKNPVKQRTHILHNS